MLADITSADGTRVLAVDEGRGPVILVVHGGSSDESAWAKVAARLSSRFRVVRVRRRQYRLDIDTGRPASIAEEASDVVAVAAALAEPMVLVGHSSGAVVALEALVASPSTFAGAVRSPQRARGWAERLHRFFRLVQAARGSRERIPNP
jgi:pimeloyl-ACP methyl ester carboxylesterase